MALPIAWSALDSGGSSDLEAWTEMLKRFLEVVNPSNTA
jgi:hypothetical protein